MKIILIHGLYMHGVVMQPLSQLLAGKGYTTDVISYNSVSIEEDDVFRSIDKLIDPSGNNILVGHSLGGLMIKHYLTARQVTAEQVSHVIAIGSPLQGASIVDAIQALGLGQILGNSTDYGLENHNSDWCFPQKLGCIAGTMAIGFRPLLIGNTHPSDGTVTLEETKITGMTDHLEINHTHTSLIFSAEVAEQIDYFIRFNSFFRQQEESTA
ncbi:Alpha/beta hydrolase family protein [Vibrio aerogenes CECT 7868]|uniref:Alpha/beta hydrolase family protein n=1 Tax=Vibrio aerogenes CECT 7868 TaxID=1216006 RepID=A0A1M6C4X0_9VIBR|nr:cobinamide adenolsyltransferase [Vibrio aerogenes]SHI56069.1 Alpha/beta hydrolase family protein [Vibrio aerogenes CECT 7868]